MRKMTTSFVAFLFVGLGLVSMMIDYGFGQTATDSASQNSAPTASYLLTRSVMGCGGIIRANSPNYLQNGTAGETLVGGIAGSKNLLLSGFWRPIARPTSVKPIDDSGAPTTFALQQSYPNPFNPQTNIEYDLPQACWVTIEVFNSIGQRIRVLVAQKQGPGRLQTVWDGRDDRGRPMGTGLYVFRLAAFAGDATGVESRPLFQQARKVLFVK